MRPILFIDFDGTLCHDRFWKLLPAVEQKAIQDFIFKDNPEIVRKWMLGAQTSEGIHDLIVDKLGLDRERIWNDFIKGCEQMAIDPAALAQLPALREKYAVILITDNMDCFDRFTVPALRLDDHFDEIICSSKEGAMKNEVGGRLFKQALSKRGSAIEECILIDNSPAMCALFEKMGGSAFLVDEDAPLEYWLGTL